MLFNGYGYSLSNNILNIYLSSPNVASFFKASFLFNVLSYH